MLWSMTNNMSSVFKHFDKNLLQISEINLYENLPKLSLIDWLPHYLGTAYFGDFNW
jgi:hypothetical protein